MKFLVFTNLHVVIIFFCFYIQYLESVSCMLVLQF